MKQFLLLTLISLFSISVNAQYVFDGNEGCTEYADSFTPANQPSLGSSTCDVNEVYGATYELNGVKYIQIGIEHGNSGQSNFRVYLNTDCQSSTGQQLAAEKFGGSVPSINVGGADYMINFTTGNNNSQTIYEWDSTTSKMVVYNGTDVESKLGNTCAGVPAFAEIRFPVDQGIFDPCDESPAPCSSVEITSILSNAGNSTNSNYCDDVQLNIPIEVNSPPVATSESSADCYTNTNGDKTVGFLLSPTTNVDSDFGDFPGSNDEVSYSWTVTPTCTDCFTNPSGTALQASDIKTYFLPTVAGTYTIQLQLTDSYGCSTASSTYSFDVTASDTYINSNPDFACLSSPSPVVYRETKAIYSSMSTVDISWSTEVEYNNEKFVVEKYDTRTKQFNVVGQIMSQGNDRQLQKYTITDKVSAYETASTYRITQVDYDGVSTSSDLITAKRSIEILKFKVYQANGSVHIDYGKVSNTASIDIHSIYGQVLYSINLDPLSNSLVLDNKVPTGMYLVTLNDTGQKSTQKLILK